MKLTTFYVSLLIILISINENSCYGQISISKKIPHVKSTLVNSDETIINVIKKSEQNQNFYIKNTQKFLQISNKPSELQRINHPPLMPRPTAEDKLFNQFSNKSPELQRINHHPLMPRPTAEDKLFNQHSKKDIYSNKSKLYKTSKKNKNGIK